MSSNSACGFAPAAGRNGRPALALHLALTLLAVAACSRSPAAAGPSPEPFPAPPETPVEGVTPSARTATFEYAPGSNQYTIESVAVVTLSSDSIPPATDSVRVTATAMIAISAGDFSRSVAGTIYDSALDEGALIRQPGPGPRTSSPGAISFVGELSPGRTTLEVAPNGVGGVEESDACDAAATAATSLVGLVREALPPIPDSITVGATWRDSVAIPTCRSGVHLVASARHEYHLIELLEVGDTTFAMVRRSTLSRVDGAGTQSRLPVTVQGVGLGASEFRIDLTNGRVVSHEGRSTLTLQHTAGARTVTMEQETALSVRLNEGN